MRATFKGIAAYAQPSSSTPTPPASGAKGLVTATGVAASSAPRGLAAAQGAVTSNHGNGRDVVTAAGGSAVQVPHGKPTGAPSGRSPGHGKGKGS